MTPELFEALWLCRTPADPPASFSAFLLAHLTELWEVVVAPGEARDDWKVLRALSEVMGKPLPYDTLYEVRERIMEIAPSMGTVGDVVPPTVSDPFAMGVDLSVRPRHCPAAPGCL